MPLRLAGAGAICFLGALLLTSCLSDGPNKVGGEYLEENGILLKTPVYRVDLSNLPVDSFWLEDLSPSRLADTTALLGVKDGFSAQMRLAFNLPDTNLLDSLEADSSLRLSLGFFRYPTHSFARPALESTLAGATQMKVLVESWVYKDVDLASEARAESLVVRSRRFIIRQDTSALIPGTPVLDTITLKLDSAYTKPSSDSLQARALENLRNTLRSDGKAQWQILIQLTPLPDTTDPGSQAMVRLGGTLSKDNPFAPWLLFGTAAKSSLDAKDGTQRIFTRLMPEFRSFPSINYKLRFSGDPNALLIGNDRGMHIRLNRAVLMDSLQKALEAQGVELKRGEDGEFDLSYFVPFAHFRLPVDTSWADVDGVRLLFNDDSELDSLLPAPDPKAMSRAVVRLGLDTPLVVTSDPSRNFDTVMFEYRRAPTADSGLRRVILRSTRNTSATDTVNLRIGETRFIQFNSTSADGLVFSVVADSAEAQVAIHLNTNVKSEDNIVRDPVTGERITDLSRRIPGFFKPGAEDSLRLRATTTFQRLVNRARMGEEIESDLLVKPAQFPAFDTAASERVPYPVLGEVRPVIDSSGNLGIGATIYLYPLKDR